MCLYEINPKIFLSMSDSPSYSGYYSPETLRNFYIKLKLLTTCDLNVSAEVHNGNLDIRFGTQSLLNELHPQTPFEIAYQTSLDNNNHWTKILINSTKISYWKMFKYMVINVRIPIHVFNYQWRFKIRSILRSNIVSFLKKHKEQIKIAIADENEDIIVSNGDWSKVLKVNIPSSLVDFEFKMGDLVEYTPIGQATSKYGTITDIIIDNISQAKNAENDSLLIADISSENGKSIESKRMVKIRNYNPPKNEILINYNRVFYPGNDNYIDLADRQEIDRRLIVRFVQMCILFIVCKLM